MTKGVAHAALRPSRPHASSAQCGRRKVFLHGKNDGLPTAKSFTTQSKVDNKS